MEVQIIQPQKGSISLMKPPQGAFLNSLVTKVCNENITEKAVLSIIQHYPNQIRFQTENLRIKGELIIAIPQIAKEYGARHEISDHLLTECIRLIFRRFRHIAVHEIREAYRMWASGEFNLKGAEMYGGEFNAMQMGKILTAYKNYRKPILAKVLNIKTEMEQDANRKWKTQKAKEQFEINFPKTIIAAKSNITRYKEVKARWYDSALKRGYFTITDEEKRKVWKEAKHLAAIEREARIQQERLGKIQMVSMDKKEIAIRISKQIIVFRKIIENPDFQIPTNEASKEH